MRGERELTRREVSRLAAALAAATYLPGVPRALAQAGGETYDDGSEAVPRAVKGEPRRVVVIGAGLAGLTVANALRNAGVEVVVLEARRRAGGRALTAEVGGHPVDLGCSWIHEPIGNPLARFADQAGVARTSADIELDLPTFRVYDRVRGAAVPLPDFTDAFLTGTRFGESLAEYAERLGPDSSIEDGGRAFLDDEGLTGDRRRLAEFTIRLVAEQTDNAHWSRISLPAASRYVPPYDGVGQGDFPAGGYRRLVEAMRGETEVRLGHVARSVERRRGGVVVRTRKGGRERVFRGSHALVTVPLGVLKAGTIDFAPALGRRRRRAIRRLGFGDLEKVSMAFAEPFWQEGSKTHVVAIGPASLPVAFSLILDAQKLSGYPVLTAFAAGRYARRLKGTGPAGRQRIVLGILDEVFGARVPRPLDFAATDWRGDRHVRGAYTYISTGHHESDLDILARPKNGRILFAGEATSRRRFGYADGAMSTGIREAKRLLQQGTVQLTAG